MPLSIVGRQGRGAVFGESRAEHDTVDGAGGDAQLTSGASIFEYHVQLTLSADDGIDRARRQTACAADAALRIDPDDLWCRLDAATRIQG